MTVCNLAKAFRDVGSLVKTVWIEWRLWAWGWLYGSESHRKLDVCCFFVDLDQIGSKSIGVPE
jgi:hypothetical protein